MESSALAWPRTGQNRSDQQSYLPSWDTKHIPDHQRSPYGHCFVAGKMRGAIHSCFVTKQLDSVCVTNMRGGRDWPAFRHGFAGCFSARLFSRRAVSKHQAAGKMFRVVWRELQDPALTIKSVFLLSVAWEGGKINLCEWEMKSESHQMSDLCHPSNASQR